MLVLKTDFMKPLLLALLVMPIMAACSMDHPTFVNQGKMTVEEKPYHTELSTADLNDKAGSAVASDYSYKGTGPLKVTVTYNPKSRYYNTAMKATNAAADFARMLKKNGVEDIQTDILPVHNSETSMTYISYTRYSASPAEGCGETIDEIDDYQKDAYRSYKLGCSVQTYMAQQMAKPADLLGRSDVHEETGARKHANNIEGYKSGATDINAVEAKSTTGN